jgi:hypothetical protein
MGRLANNDLERIEKEAIVAQSKYYPWNLTERTEENYEDPKNIACSLAEILTEHLLNINLEPYHKTNLPGHSYYIVTCISDYSRGLD